MLVHICHRLWKASLSTEARVRLKQKRLDVKLTQTSMLKAAQVNGQLHPIFVIKHVPVFTAEWLDSLYRR